MADALKAEGNKLFAAKKFPEAVEKFTEAIEIDPTNHVLYSNRSGAYASLRQFDKALEDADKVIELKPDWPKGYTRKGAALHGLKEYLGAYDAYEDALKYDPNNAQAKAGRDSVDRAMKAEVGAQDGDEDPLGFDKLLSDPNLMQKLASNPKTSSFISDPAFMAKLQKLKNNPADLGDEIRDPRIMTVLGVLLGIDIIPGGAPQGSSSQDVPMPDAPAEPARSASRPAPREPTPEPTPEDEEAKEKREAKAKADEEKALGNQLYKKRQFDDAIAHYAKAWDLNKDISYLTNMGAAKFEKGDYEGCIEACQQAIAEGRDMLADFKLIARAFGRVGAAYEKLGDYTNAIKNYQSSLTEHRTPDILAKLRAAEKAKALAEKNAYIDADKAEEARVLGQERFKAADWPGAVEAYTEMIKRSPDDPRGYSNRAACFIKLLAYPSAVQDCDEAIKRDPKFIRAYVRKAQSLFAMREYNKALDVCDEADQQDTAHAHSREIDEQRQRSIQAQFSAREGETEQETLDRIQRDPEILKILQDPVMQSILQQAKSDPAALQEHLKNPQVRSSIQKLVAAGVIRLGR